MDLRQVAMAELASPTVRFRLREATRREHDAVDALYSRYDLTRTDDYAAFLARQAAAHIPVEQALDLAGAASVLEDWPARRRGGLIEADLIALGATLRMSVPAPPFATRAALLGGLYVLEGSRLGGAVLRKRVAPGAPTKFLSAPSPQGAWSRLLALLEHELGREADLAEAIASARAVFSAFARAGNRDVETPLGR